MCLPVSVAPVTVSLLCCRCSLILFIGQRWLPLPPCYWAELPIALQDVLVTLPVPPVWSQTSTLCASAAGSICLNKTQLLLPGRPKHFQLSLVRKHSWVLFVVPSIAKSINRHTAEEWKNSPTPSVLSMWCLAVCSIFASHWTWTKIIWYLSAGCRSFSLSSNVQGH